MVKDVEEYKLIKNKNKSKNKSKVKVKMGNTNVKTVYIRNDSGVDEIRNYTNGVTTLIPKGKTVTINNLCKDCKLHILHNNHRAILNYNDIKDRGMLVITLDNTNVNVSPIKLKILEPNKSKFGSSTSPNYLLILLIILAFYLVKKKI